MQILKTDLKTKNFKRIYLFFGEDYFKKYYCDLFKQAMLDPLTQDMNFTKYEGNINLATIVETARTVPFLGDRRLVVAKKTSIFVASAKTDPTLLQTIPQTTTVIFVEDNIDKRTKMYKELAKIGTCIDFVIPKESELTTWIVGFFKKQNKKISSTAASYFLKNVTYDMNTIVMELKKLAAYCDNEITQKDIDIITTKSTQTKIFNMLKALGQKNPSQALIEYNNMIQAKTEPIMILTMIARQFRQILRTKALAAQGCPQEQIAKELGVQSFVVRECLGQAKNFKYNVLINALEQCLMTDIAIKTGAIEAKVGVEMVLVRFGGG